MNGSVKVYEKICKAVEDIEKSIINYRRDFHRYPELGWMEFRTASLIARRLIEFGYDVKLGREVIKDEFRAGLPTKEELDKSFIRAIENGADRDIAEKMKGGFTGVVGILKNGEGPVIALRFDMDALLIKESEKEGHLPFEEGFYSINKNIMHSCGHDGHAAIGLGVAEILSIIKENLNGTVKIIFQPAEEGVRGAKAMVEAGVLDDVDYLISGHIGIKAKKSGEIVCNTGGFLATSKVDAFFKGKASHAGAAPEKGNNALLSAATAVLNLHSIPRSGQGITRINVGRLEAGGQRNIIPESAYMEIEIRGETGEIVVYMKEYVKRILLSSAQMHGTFVDIKYLGESIEGKSSPELVDLIVKAANVCGYTKVYDKEVDFGASEDITNMMKRVKCNGGKAAYIMFGSDLKGEHHNPEFDFNEDDLKNAVKAYSLLTFDILK